MASRRSSNIDVLRAVAAVSVLGFHANGLFLQYQWRSPSWDRDLRYSLFDGVYLFFAISGYLLGRPFIRALTGKADEVDTKTYLRRRAARILPGYWMAYTVALLTVLQGGLTVMGVTSHYLLFNDFVPGEARHGYGISWTLDIEAEFYLALPLLAALARHFHPRGLTTNGVLRHVLIGGACSLILAQAVSSLSNGGSGSLAVAILLSLPASFRFFVPGLVVACFVEMRNPRSEVRTRTTYVSAVLAFAVWSAVSVIDQLLGIPAGLDVLYTTVVAMASGLALFAAVTAPTLGGRVWQSLTLLGVWSYGIYLWHPIVGAFMAKYGLALGTHIDDISWFLNAVLVLLVTLPMAAVSWYLVERPAIEWSHYRPRVAHGLRADRA